MNNITFGQYYPGNSWIYKIDPRTKILLTIAYVILIFLIPNLEIMVLAFLILLLIFLTTRIPVLKVLKGLKGVLFLLLFTIILQLIYIKDDTAMPMYSFQMSIGWIQIGILVGLVLLYLLTSRFIKFKFLYLLVIVFLGFVLLWNNPFEQFYWDFKKPLLDWTFDVYEKGAKTAGFIFLRITMMIVITSLLTLSTMTTDINSGLEWILAPLKIIKIPVGVFAMLISLTLRFIPTLLEETKKIMNAQSSRGADFNEGKLTEKVRQVISLLIPMFVLSFKRAEDLSNAMEARGYIIGAPRTKIDKLTFNWRDYICYFITLVFLGLVIWSMVYYG